MDKQKLIIAAFLVLAFTLAYAGMIYVVGFARCWGTGRAIGFVVLSYFSFAVPIFLALWYNNWTKKVQAKANGQ